MASHSDARDWFQMGSNAAGEEIWERIFSVGEDSRDFLVTVLFDARTGRTRALYTARLVITNKVPGIPQGVRRQVERFRRQLQENVRRSA